MTKEEFIKIWPFVEPVVSKPVNGQLAVECDCEFIDHVGGYQLNLRPQSLMWEWEMIALFSAANLFCCSVQCSFKYGLIRIY